MMALLPTSAPDPASVMATDGQHPSLAPGSAPVTTPDTTVDPTADDGDHERFAHICRKEDVTRAYITGEAIEALCGKKWVPTRDPDRYPVCPECKKALGRVKSADSN